MPIARFQLPDGRIGRFEVPEGTTPEAAQSQIEQIVSSQGQMQAPAQPPAQMPTANLQSTDVPTDENVFVQGIWNKLIRQESGGNQSAVSPKGAIGRAQVMPATAPEAAALAGLPFDENAYRTDGAYNERLGQAYLRKQFQDFQDGRLALAAYNAGPGRVRQTLERVGDPRTGEVTWDGFLAALPTETRDYVSKIAGGQPKDEGIRVPEWVKEAGRVIDTGIKQGVRAPGEIAANVYRGAEQVARAPYELAAGAFGTTVDEVLSGLSQYLPEQTPGQYLQQGVQALTTPIERPKTDVGQTVADVGGATLAGALVPFPGVSLATGAGQGFAAGVGGEVATHAFGDNPLVQAGGSLAGGGLASVAQSLSKSSVKTGLAKEALEGISDYELAAAGRIMEEAKRQGVNLTLAQAIPTKSNLPALEKVLMGSPGGQALVNQLRQQPEELAGAARAFQQTIPGEVLPAGQVNAQAQEAATKVIQDVKNWRTSQVKPYYAASGNLSIEHSKKIVKDLFKLADDNPGTAKGDLIRRLADKLQVTKPVYKAGVKIGEKKIPITDISKFNAVLKSEQNAAKNINLSSAAGDAEAIGLLNSVATGLRQELGSVSEPFRKGNQLYGALTETVVNPVKTGPAGQIAGRAGYQSGVAAPARISKIFSEGTPIDPKSGRAKSSNILTLQSQMARTGPDGAKAFADAGASWFAEGFRKALSNEAGTTTADAAKRIESQFFGDPSKVQGTKDILSGIAKSSGVPEKDLVDGMENFIRTVQRAASIPLENPGTAAQGVREAVKTPWSAIGQWTAIQPFRQPALLVQSRLQRGAVEDISALLQSPTGIADLKKFARVEPGSTASYKALSQISALFSQLDQGEE